MSDEHSPNPYEAPQSELRQSPVPAQLVRVNPIYFEGNLEQLGKWLLDLYAVRVSGLGKLLLQPGISYALVLIMLLMSIFFIKLTYSNKVQEISLTCIAVSIPSIFICYYYQRKWLPVWNQAVVPQWFPTWLWWILRITNVVGYQFLYLRIGIEIILALFRLENETRIIWGIVLSNVLLLPVLLLNAVMLLIARRTGYMKHVIILWLNIILFLLLPIVKYLMLDENRSFLVIPEFFAYDIAYLIIATLIMNNRLAQLGCTYCIEHRFAAIEVLDIEPTAKS